jgi:hypothetical protein
MLQSAGQQISVNRWGRSKKLTSALTIFNLAGNGD